MTNTTAAQPLDLDKLETLAKAATRGPWSRSARLNGPFWHISSGHTIGGEPCKSGRQAIAAVHGESKKGATAYAAMFEANADFIAVANPSAILALIAQARAAQPAAQAVDAPTDEQIIAALHANGIDTYPSKCGFDAVQVSATSVPNLRKVLETLAATRGTK